MSSAVVCDLCGQIINMDSPKPRISVTVYIKPMAIYDSTATITDFCENCSVRVLASYPMLCPKFGVNE